MKNKRASKTTKKTIKVKYSKTPKDIFNELKDKLGSLKKVSEETGLSYYETRKLNAFFNKPKPSLFKLGKKPRRKSAKVKEKTSKTYTKRLEKVKKVAQKKRIRLTTETVIIKGKTHGIEKISLEGVSVTNRTRLFHARFSVLYVSKKGEKFERYLSQTFYPPYTKNSPSEIIADCVEFLKAQSGKPYIAYIVLLDFSVVTYEYEK